MPRLTLKDAELAVAVQALLEGWNGGDAARGSSRRGMGEGQLRWRLERDAIRSIGPAVGGL